MRLGDFIAFDTNNLNIVYSVEFKSSLRVIDPINVDLTFGKKFYYKFFGEPPAKLIDINNLTINDKDLTEKFKLGRELATNIQNHSTFKHNTISYTLKNLFKLIYVIKK